MIIDEVDEQVSNIEEKPEKIQASPALKTINSLVEKEICRTLGGADRPSVDNTIPPEKLALATKNPNSSIPSASPTPPTSSLPPPPLVTLSKPRSPSVPFHPSHNQQTFASKGSIVRGTPISPSNKPISIDTSTTHPHIHSQNYPSPRGEYSHHSSPYLDVPHIKSSKHIDQQHLYHQQQQQQNNYMSPYSHQQSPHSSYPAGSSSAQYLQSHKSSSVNPQQQNLGNINKPLGIDTSNTDTYETLRADFVTSRYLTTGHSPNHER